MATTAEDLVTRLAAQDPGQVAARRDVLDYLCAGQLYLHHHVPDLDALTPSDVKQRPTGHWGVCPNVNAVVATLAPVLSAGRVELVHGAGHAGAAALARAWLDGALAAADPRFARDRAGLDALFAAFPAGPWGGEVTPLIPGVRYMGGQLGPALAYAAGTVLDEPERIVLPLVGDGECETGETAAGWLATRALRSSCSRHGRLVPIVLLNGLRMGGPSLLSGLAPYRLVEYFAGLGWTPHLADGSEPVALTEALATACGASGPVGSAEQHLVVCVMPKGAGAPARDSRGAEVLGTTRVHKTPLSAPAADEAELAVLRRWLATYRPGRLFDESGPTAATHWPQPAPAAAPRVRTASTPSRPTPATSFTQAVSTVLRTHAGPNFRVFSPDELSSNRVDAEAASAGRPCVEVLNESMCHLWLQGYLEGGGRGIFITYEAFAAVTISLLRQYAKTRALADRGSGMRVATLVYLVTSLCWTNNYSHQDPVIYGMLLDTALAEVKVLFPADPTRLAATLDRSLRGTGGIELIAASKTAARCYPVGPLAAELEDGIAAWPEFSDHGTPDIVLCGAGDVATGALLCALDDLRGQQSGLVVHYVCLHDLLVLNPASQQGARITPARMAELFPGTGPVVFAVPGYPTPVKAMLFDRPDLAVRSTVLGYADPGEIISQTALLNRTGLSGAELVEYLVGRVRARRAEHRTFPDRPVDYDAEEPS